MSMDAEDVMKRAECPTCEEGCEDYAPGVSSTTVDGIMYHPGCVPAPEGHSSVASAAYAKAVHDRLTIGVNATRSHKFRDSLLDDEETAELVECYLLGTPAVEFAKRLEARDIALFEAVTDPYPQRQYPEVEMN